jgi:hypothetical protein
MKPDAIWDILAFLDNVLSKYRVMSKGSFLNSPFMLVPIRLELCLDERRVRLPKAR